MVTTLTQERTVAINLGATSAALHALPGRPQQMDDYADWWDDWIEVMARFEWVLDLMHEGKLDRPHRAECERLLRQLREHLPLAKQLALEVPRKILDAIKEVS